MKFNGRHIRDIAIRLVVLSLFFLLGFFAGIIMDDHWCNRTPIRESINSFYHSLEDGYKFPPLKQKK